MSTKKEQEALVAFFNSFELRKPLASFKQLSDGKVFMEVSTCGLITIMNRQME
jgi:hypothetical protein